ncbi:hypothetical protein SteCoe_36281 [Stentor coeruleus]|uniref:RING-CH-type domain-containing protein n=1 Tax=Stentor coeruleus TaxID=5963 RepID=A0A1R2AQP1_9CILI|nr:hypothetical protein SteCoe_36281 [Stentor coeruleus]
MESKSQVKELKNSIKLDQTPSYICRICFDSNLDDLISPCKCSGSSKYTHEQCLKTWLCHKNPNLKSPSCEICGSSFNIEMKKSFKCALEQDSNKKMVLYCKIFVFLGALFMLGVVILISVVFYIDLEKKLVYSILLLIACSIPVCLCVYFLSRNLINLCIKIEVIDWKIISYSRKSSPNASITEPNS